MFLYKNVYFIMFFFFSIALSFRYKKWTINILGLIIKKAPKKNREKFQNLSEKEKEEKWPYGRKRYESSSENEKQKLVKYI